MNSNDRYRKSEQWLERALRSIPLGSQTFSKSLTQYPRGVSPFFIDHAKGSRCWDVDGNEYIDFVNSLCAINLGHCDPDITLAVQNQLERGTVFSLPHPLEVLVAEKMKELVPGAERVRFGKNGSDATSAAVRIARAYTQRDHIAVCGYHGWHNWYIGSTTRNLGVPKSSQELTHKFEFNQIESLHSLFQKFPSQIAAVIMEPMNVSEPKDHFLHQVKELCHKNGALFILDETITGFRFARGGAQELFTITADLSTFGKGMANGYPLSTIVGQEKYMRLMEDIFFSTTFGGETLSLAAGLATMTKIQTQPVIEKLYKTGDKILSETRKLLKKHKLEESFEICGNPTWSFLIPKDHPNYSQWKIKTFFLQEIFENGILTLGTHNVSYAHTEEDLKRLFQTYDKVFEKISVTLTNRSLEKELRCQALQPLFKVR